MKNYSTVLFDLDGTLTDSGEGIMNSVVYSLEKMGAPVPDADGLRRFVGPPLMTSFKVFCGFDEEESQRALKFYREYFVDRGMFENSVYEGVPALLSALRSSGKKVLLATSKPEVFAKQILEHFDLFGYFDFVAGSLLDETRTKKEEVIQYLLDSVGVNDTSELIMVGDREYDVRGARHFGMDSLGVLYGYGDRAELEGAGATYIAETVDEIRTLICGE